MKNVFVLLMYIMFINMAKAQENPDDFFYAEITPDNIYAGDRGSFTIYLHPKQTIKSNTVFKIRFPKGFKDLQHLFSALPGYVRGQINPRIGQFVISSVVPSYNENLDFWDMNNQDKVITAAIRNTDVNPGDTLVITIGIGTGANAETQSSNTAWKEDIEIAMTDNGTAKNFKLSPTPIPFEVKGKPAQTVILFVNSVAKPGEESKLLVTTADEFYNIDPSFVGKIQLTAHPANEVVLPADIQLLPEDSGKKEIPVFFLKEGVYTISGIVEGKNIPVQKSNPIKVSQNTPHIYWGDLHSHGAPSRDGYGRGRYEYARYARGLDFMCATDHADHGKTIYGLTDREWTRQIKEIRDNHAPGKFIPFIGYENSFLYPIGHYNIIFNVKDEDLESVPMWTMGNVNDIQTIWSLAQERGIDVLTIPHHCGKVFNINVEGTECKSCNTFGGIHYNSKYKRLIEIYSRHGLSESYNPHHNLDYSNKSDVARSFDGPHFAQDAWAMGERLGVIASSDDHSGHPGHIIDGIVAVYANELDRDTLYHALYNKHTYGTTGEKIWIDFKVDGALMGSSLEIPSNRKPVLYFEIIGTDTIDFVEVLKWDFKRGVMKDGHPEYEILKRFDTDMSSPLHMVRTFLDVGFTDSCLYYLRVKQKNFHIEYTHAKDVWGWTSPVWVSHLDTLLSGVDSLREYIPSIYGKAVRHQWSMTSQKGVTQYIIERKSEGDLWYKVFDLIPSDPDQKDFDYIETNPNNGLNEYRLLFHSVTEDTIYSDVKSVFITLDTVTSHQINWENDQVVLSWNTLNELHTISYIIEKEEDGLFELLEVVDARKNLSEINSFYTWTFENLPVGVHKFRITQILPNNKKNYFYLEIERVATKIKYNKTKPAFELKNNVVNTSNPVVYIKISEDVVGADLELIDMSGKTLQLLGSIKETGSWQSYLLRNLPAGGFRLIMKLPSGLIYSQPIIVVN